MKILLIGQAPPNVEQKVPYDTTMLYEWLSEVGVSKQDAQCIFDFDAVYDKFPGFSKSGGHLRPTTNHMEEYWNRSLKYKVDKCKSVLVLGACARDFLRTKNILKPMEFVIHPSRRNYNLYIKLKQGILQSIKNLIHENYK